MSTPRACTTTSQDTLRWHLWYSTCRSARIEWKYFRNVALRAGWEAELSGKKLIHCCYFGIFAKNLRVILRRAIPTQFNGMARRPWVSPGGPPASTCGRSWGEPHQSSDELDDDQESSGNELLLQLSSDENDEMPSSWKIFPGMNEQAGSVIVSIPVQLPGMSSW